MITRLFGLPILLTFLTIPSFAISDISEVDQAVNEIMQRMEVVNAEPKSETRAAKLVILMSDLFAVGADLGTYLENDTKLNASDSLSALEGVNQALANGEGTAHEREMARQTVARYKAALDTLKESSEGMLESIRAFDQVLEGFEEQIATKYPEAKVLPILAELVEVGNLLVSGYEAYGNELIEYVNAVSAAESGIVNQTPNRQQMLDDLRQQNSQVQNFRASEEFTFDGMKEKFTSISTVIKMLYNLD